MIQIAATSRVWLAVKCVDFRKGIDGLAQVCRSVLGNDPFSGHVFVFCNRRRTALKILMYDGQGFWLCQKRLSQGRFKWWPQDGAAHRLDVGELQLLLWNGDPDRAGIAPFWRRL